MRPEIVKVGPLSIHTYGLMLAIAFLIGLLISLHEAKRKGEDPSIYSDLFLGILISAVIGARILFVLFFIKDYIKNPIAILNIQEGGLIFFGGVLAALVFLYLYTKKKKLSILRIMDTLTPSLAIGYAIARIGCLSAGCCYGKPTDGPLSITFTDPKCLVPLYLRGVPLYPTQIFEMLNGLVTFGILWFSRTKIKKEGVLTALFLILFGIFRGFIEFFRGDVRGAILLGMSESQLISFVQAIIGLFLIIYLSRKHAKPSIGS